MAITEFFISRYTGEPTTTKGKANYTLLSINELAAKKGQDWEVWSQLTISPPTWGIVSEPVDTYSPLNGAVILFKLVSTVSAVEDDDSGKEHMQQFSMFLMIKLTFKFYPNYSFQI